jgi:hypothetical protein
LADLLEIYQNAAAEGDRLWIDSTIFDFYLASGKKI